MVVVSLTRGCLIQCLIIVKCIGRILYWLLNAGGSLFQVDVRTGLTVCHNAFSVSASSQNTELAFHLFDVFCDLKSYSNAWQKENYVSVCLYHLYQARAEIWWSGSASLAIPILFLVLPDKLYIKNTLTWCSLFVSADLCKWQIRLGMTRLCRLVEDTHCAYAV